jgi:hypothetical protein
MISRVIRCNEMLQDAHLQVNNSGAQIPPLKTVTLTRQNVFVDKCYQQALQKIIWKNADVRCEVLTPVKMKMLIWFRR